MRIPAIVQILWHSGSFIVAGIGWTTDMIPQDMLYIFGAIWLATFGWTLCFYRNNIVILWRKIFGKSEQSKTAQYEILQHWDEPKNDFESMLQGMLPLGYRKFPKIIKDPISGEIKEIKHPNGDHWSNKK